MSNKIHENVPFLTPIESNELSFLKIPAYYLWFGGEVAEHIKAPLVDGTRITTKSFKQTSCTSTALKIATYILSFGIFPLLALLTLAISRCVYRFNYVRNSNVELATGEHPHATAEVPPASKEAKEEELVKMLAKSAFDGSRERVLDFNWPQNATAEVPPAARESQQAVPSAPANQANTPELEDVKIANANESTPPYLEEGAAASNAAQKKIPPNLMEREPLKNPRLSWFKDEDKLSTAAHFSPPRKVRGLKTPSGLRIVISRPDLVNQQETRRNLPSSPEEVDSGS